MNYPERITSSHIHHLQAIYHNIDNRGICIDLEAIDNAKKFVDMEINRNLSICSTQWGCHIFVGATNSYAKDHVDFDNQVNLNASQGERTLLAKLKVMGYEVPKVYKRNEEGEYEGKYSAGELTLQKMLITNQFNFTGGDPAIRAVLQVRELTKLRSSYLNCRFYRAGDGNLLYLSHYNAAGTLTGRRSSKKHTFGFGNNAQNFPKHGKLAKMFRRCLTSRPGHIFLMVDQKGAEEWPVNALAENHKALAEMRAGVNRHIRRAAGIFSIAESVRTDEEWKDSIEYYLGKKTGHANNYGMRGQRMSDSLVQEGHVFPPKACDQMLERLNILEPNTRGVFHVYVKNKIINGRILATPYGRERQFLGLRPNDNNYKVFNEAFAWIPQSTVGDNTGFAVRYLEDELPKEQRAIVQEGHDSIVQDILDRLDEIWNYLTKTVRSFDRVARFENGIEINIPVEAEIGYDFATTVKLKDLSYDGLEAAYKKLQLKREEELDNKAAQKKQQDLLNLASSLTI